MKMIKGITLQDQLAQNAICREEIARLEKIVEDLKAENEEIRQHCITHETCSVVIKQTEKDTAREMLQQFKKCADSGVGLLTLLGSRNERQELFDSGYKGAMRDIKLKITELAAEYGVEVNK